MPKDVQLRDIKDASLLDFTSRVRSPQIGQIVIFENHQTRYAAAQIRGIQDDTRNDRVDRLVFDYWILDDGSDDFSTIS